MCFVLFFHSPPGSTGLEITPETHRPTAPSLSSRSIHLMKNNIILKKEGLNISHLVWGSSPILLLSSLSSRRGTTPAEIFKWGIFPLKKKTKQKQSTLLWYYSQEGFIVKKESQETVLLLLVFSNHILRNSNSNCHPFFVKWEYNQPNSSLFFVNLHFKLPVVSGRLLLCIRETPGDFQRILGLSWKTEFSSSIPVGPWLSS